MLSGSFMDYVMPRADEMPLFDVDAHEVPTRVNPLGAKGVGEAGTVGALPALMNAVNDALAHLGVRHLDMPVTPRARLAGHPRRRQRQVVPTDQKRQAQNSARHAAA